MEPELSNTTAISRLLTSRVPPAAHAPCITHGSSIKAARKAYDALSDAQKELVTNYQTLLDAEKSYKKLTRPTGGSSSSSTTDDKKNDGKDVKSGNTGDAGITLYLGMGLVAVMAGAVIVTRKRKEN